MLTGSSEWSAVPAGAPPRGNVLVRALILFVAYSGTAMIGLAVHSVSGFATLVWPPTGIALAALLIWGRGLWPVITVAAFMV
ncbi:MAG: hypothetical protein H6Q89_3328, partial [Myxococcaceae bacterium]|nr:hypothetical protein [Myxococcaceae bacterium]